MKPLKIIGVIILILVLFRACSIITDSNEVKETPPASKADTKTEESLRPQKADLEILKQKGTSDENGFATIYATVKNNTDQLKKYVQVDVVVYDKNGDVLGTGLGNTTNLPGNKNRVITCLVNNIYEKNWTYTAEISGISH